MPIALTAPIADYKTYNALLAGDSVLISGTIYCARDAAHARMSEILDNGGALPFDLNNNIIYYMGPSPARPGRPIGSAGPTTSGRMDVYTPRLLRLGLKGMIGKGGRTKDVIDAMKETKAVYFAAIGGAGALLSKAITASKVIAFEDLGAESIRELRVKNFPVFVAIDCLGNSVYG